MFCSATLNLGETTLELHHVGGHSADSIVVHAVEDRILMTGDNITSAMHPYKGHAHFGDWIRALEFMDALDVEKIIPGHGPLSTLDDLRVYKRMLDETIGLVREQMDAGASVDEIVARGPGD